MKLLTKEILNGIPNLDETDGKDPSEVKVWARFFLPGSDWTWYATEFDGDDRFFGLVSGFEAELGYFSLSELQRVRSRFGLRVERDMYYNGTLEDAKKESGYRF